MNPSVFSELRLLASADLDSRSLLTIILANDLLAAGCHQERELLDEKLYFETFALDPKPAKKA